VWCFRHGVFSSLLSSRSFSLMDLVICYGKNEIKPVKHSLPLYWYVVTFLSHISKFFLLCCIKPTVGEHCHSSLFHVFYDQKEHHFLMRSWDSLMRSYGNIDFPSFIEHRCAHTCTHSLLCTNAQMHTHTHVHTCTFASTRTHTHTHTLMNTQFYHHHHNTRIGPVDPFRDYWLVMLIFFSALK
jgi:hypothetical protein